MGTCPRHMKLIALLTGIFAAVLSAGFSAPRAWATNAACVPPPSAPVSAATLASFPPAYTPVDVVAAFKALGWTCRPYSSQTGITCRGTVPGYSDQIDIIVPRIYVPKSRADLFLYIHGNQWGGSHDDMAQKFGY